MNRKPEETAICTIATASHFSAAMCLANSFLAHHRSGKVYILQVGDENLSLSKYAEKIEIVKVGQLSPAAEIASMRERYNTFEFCNALKPYLLKHLLARRTHDKICYFDSDIYIYDNLQRAIWDELDNNSILLTPHLIRPAKHENAFEHDFVILRRGVYNAGFIGLRADEKASEFLDWWKSRVLRGGYHRPDDGYNCDQGWLDIVPGFDLDVKIERDTSLNVAFWNLHERKIEKIENRYFVEGKPLLFFHFSGYSTDKPDVLTKHDAAVNFSVYPVFRRLFDEYGEKMLAAKIDSIEMRLNHFSNQTIASENAEKAPEIIVSVVIPAFNAEKHIAQAVESTLGQSEHRLEIVVVDDGSTDETAAIVRRYGGKVRLIRQETGGVAAARNRGILEAKGEFIHFLDADDYFLLSTKIEKQIYLARQSDCDAVMSGWRIVDENGQTMVVREPWQNVPVLNAVNFLRWQLVLPSAMLFKRAALTEIGGFDEELPPVEDLDLVLRFLLAGFRLCWLEQVAVAYRQHDGNASGQVAHQAKAIEKLWNKFFGQKDLPADLKRLESHVRYSAFVWLAARFYLAGDLSAMKLNLFASLSYAPFTGDGILLDWTNRFLGLASETRKTVDVFDLTGSPEWQLLEKIITPEKKLAETEVPEKRVYAKPPVDLLMKARIEETARAGAEHDFLIRETPLRETPLRETPLRYKPKISLRSTFRDVMGVHRSGWKFALQSLVPLHTEDGILFDGSSDLRFDTEQQGSLRKLEAGWIGVFHLPPQMPEWFASGRTQQKILASYNFKSLLKTCHGIFCLSENHRDWLREQIDVPVHALIHPTETPEIKFSVERFRANPNPRVVQIGHWLRKLNSIYLLPTTLRRTIVHQKFDYVNEFFEREKNLYNLSVNSREVEILPFLSNEDYDLLLAENLVYLELYDATVNNAIIECIVRNTPVLVNPLPAVREYLGDRYPFYFNSRMEAARKSEDLNLIIETHEYLKDLPIKEKLTAEYFLQSVAESEIYRSLPV